MFAKLNVNERANKHTTLTYLYFFFMNLHLKNENKIHRNLYTEVENYFELPLNISVETFKGDFQAELPLAPL